MHGKLYKRSWSKGWRLGKLEHSMLYEEFGALMYLVSRCTWPSQFAMQAHGLEQEPMLGTLPIYNQLLQNSRTEHSYFLYSKQSMLTHIKLMASHNRGESCHRSLHY